MSIFLDNTYVSKTGISEIATGDSFDCTLGMDTSIRVSHELTESPVTSLPSSFMEQYTTTTYVSTMKLHNWHTGGYPVNIIERSSIPITLVNDPQIKVFLKGPTGLVESEEGEEVDLGREDGFKVKRGRDMEDTKDGQKEGKFIWFGTISPGKEVVLVSKWCESAFRHRVESQIRVVLTQAKSILGMNGYTCILWAEWVNYRQVSLGTLHCRLSSPSLPWTRS